MAYQFIARASNEIAGCRFNPVLVEDVLFNGKPIALVAWEDENTPHVDFITESRKLKFCSTVEFFLREFKKRVIVESFSATKNLFDHVAKHTNLKFVRKAFDKYGRGVVYIYEVNHGI